MDRGGCGVHLSPWIHQEYTFRHRSACRTPAESGHEYMTSEKEYITQSCPTLCDPMNRNSQASLSITISWSSLKLTSMESVMPSSHLILCCPLLLPPIPPSIRVFSNESTLCMRWPKYWSYSFSIIPSKEIPGLISSQNGLVGSPCSPRDSQESSPTPQFKSINSSVLSFLHSLALTSIHDHWKNHSLD